MNAQHIQLVTKPNGDLEMTADQDGQASIRRLLRNDCDGYSMLEMEAAFICDYLPNPFKQIKPEDCGALTDAPLITNGTDVWGYMNYQVENFLALLSTGATITWQKG
jgi:hypothetical protein